MTIASLIDLASYALLVITIALIGIKIVDLWAPHLWRGPSLVVRLSGTAEEARAGLLALESGLTALAVIASTAPFVGLMGTVLHIMEALSRVSTSLDTAVISGPIATALNATLVGLASAVPAAAAHAFFVRRLRVLEATYCKEGGDR